jgi:hypothetical protein
MVELPVMFLASPIFIPEMSFFPPNCLKKNPHLEVLYNSLSLDS